MFHSSENFISSFDVVQGYVEEFRDITKGKSKESLPVPNIMLINQRPVGEDFQVSVLFIIKMLYH